MSDHIVRAFDDKLEELQNLTTRMGGLAESQLTAAIDAIVKRDSSLAEKTIAGDAKIDDLGAEIEVRAVRLLALRQPVADDLRLVIAAIKIAPDLERIGDLAKNLAKRALVLNRAEPMRITQGLAAMGRQALSQLASVLNAYSSRDGIAAREVRAKDPAIDEMYNSLFRELLTYMMEDPRTIGLCTHLLFVAKNLERIGDHATNIAESIIFAIEGRYLTEERPKSDMTSTLDIKG